MKFKCLTASALLLVLGAFTSCQSDMTEEVNGGIQPNGSGRVMVSASVSIEGTSGGTRAEGYDPTQADPTQSYISAGYKIDRLIYALYKKDANGEFKLPVENDPTDVYGITRKTCEFSARKPIQINMIVDSLSTYRMVFWAQNSTCNAYDTEDLENISIGYEALKNNDENRDAFTTYIEFRGDVGEIDAELRRPFAQINVGTTGADYKSLIYDPNLKPDGITLTESRITVTGVANKYNALTGKATATDMNLEADFDWAQLPAWIVSGKPTGDPSTSYEEDANPYVELPSEQASQKEEFLMVDLNGDKELLPYKMEYPTLNETETFKYMSMCYVLVPSNAGTVKVNYNFRQNGANGSVPLAEKEINNVPVEANWRTNILHGLYTEYADPTSVFNGVTLPIILNDHFDYHFVIANPENSEQENP